MPGIVRQIARTLRRIVGAPDYEAYLTHMREQHPRATPISRAEFEHQRLAARYDRPGARCC